MTSTPAPPVAPALTCPRCQASAPAGTRFCPNCGAALAAAAPSGASPPPPPGAPPVDIRTRVDDDRGLLKRLQLLMPGYRGYRQGEDIRAADSLLRLQIADRVARARGSIESARTTLTQAGRFDRLNDLAALVADLMKLEGEIRHAEQGYSGISPAIRVQAGNLDRLYEYDYGFASASTELGQGVDAISGAVSSGDDAAMAAIVQKARGQVGQLDSAFKARMRAIEGIQVG